VAVEKLAHSEFAKIGSRHEALLTIFPSLLDIFYHPIFDFFQTNHFFNISHRDYHQLPPRCVLVATVGDLKTFGLFKTVHGTPFAYRDTPVLAFMSGSSSVGRNSGE
jgi:hypothetical protein